MTRLRVSVSDLFPYVESKDKALIIHLFERDTSTAYGYLRLIDINDRLDAEEIRCDRHGGKDGFKCIKVVPREGAYIKLEKYYRNKRLGMASRSFIVLKFRDGLWEGYQDVY